MNDPFALFAVFTLLTMIVGLGRVFRGPTRADRMLSAQLSGTTIVAVLLLFAQSRKNFYLLDVALVFAMLTAVATVAFVRLIWKKSSPGPRRGSADA